MENFYTRLNFYQIDWMKLDSAPELQIYDRLLLETSLLPTLAVCLNIKVTNYILFLLYWEVLKNFCYSQINTYFKLLLSIHTYFISSYTLI